MYDYDKVMISLFDDVIEADKYIEKMGIISLDDKIEYLIKTFQIQLISITESLETNNDEQKKMDYFALLNSIIFPR